MCAIIVIQEFILTTIIGGMNMSRCVVEEWESVDGYEGTYEVSNLGNVRSVDREIVYSNGNVVACSGKPKKATVDKYGYKYVSLYLNQKHEQGMVHRLVAEAFLDNEHNKPQVNHIDGDKLNNSSENLEWVTSQENMTHAKENGLLESVSGEGHYRSKLDNTKVREIRRRAGNGERYQDLGDEFGVVKSTIGFIVNRKTWKHVK